MTADDLLVVGLDLDRDCEVHVGEAPLAEWQARGYSGDRSLVCALCFAGIDVAVGTRVPLVVRGRVGGLRRPHFAHPPGQAPPGRHHPESVWHLTAKTALATWAVSVDEVSDVDVERWTPDRSRRSDIRVELHGGHTIVLEVQASPLTDEQWRKRHADYQHQHITDVWVWRPGSRPHWILAETGLPLWEYDPTQEHATLLLGAGHEKPVGWWNEPDARVYTVHTPVCPGDRIIRRDCDLTVLRLDETGIPLPDDVRAELDQAHAEVRQLAERLRTRTTTQPRHRPAAPGRIPPYVRASSAAAASHDRSHRANKSRPPPERAHVHTGTERVGLRQVRLSPGSHSRPERTTHRMLRRWNIKIVIAGQLIECGSSISLPCG